MDLLFLWASQISSTPLNFCFFPFFFSFIVFFGSHSVKLLKLNTSKWHVVSEKLDTCYRKGKGSEHCVALHFHTFAVLYREHCIILYDRVKIFETFRMFCLRNFKEFIMYWGWVPTFFGDPYKNQRSALSILALRSFWIGLPVGCDQLFWTWKTPKSGWDLKFPGAYSGKLFNFQEKQLCGITHTESCAQCPPSPWTKRQQMWYGVSLPVAILTISACFSEYVSQATDLTFLPEDSLNQFLVLTKVSLQTVLFVSNLGMALFVGRAPKAL